MKKILLCVMCFLAFACKKTENNIIDPAPAYKQIKLAEGSEKVITSSNSFGLDIFRKVVADEPEDKNLFISPTSLALALSMTWNGAQGDTKDSMSAALQMPPLSDQQINAINQSLIQGLTNADPEVTLNIANSIWYKDNFEVVQNFVQVNKDYYSAEVSALDFNAPSATEIINGWVEEKTGGKIKNLIDQIEPEDVMFLIDAIYFKGTWKIAFDKNATKEAGFKLSDGSLKTVPMMDMKDTLDYLENDLFQAVDLNYGSGNFSMVILLPKENHTTGDIITALTPENWQSWINLFKRQVLGVYLPKFKFDYGKKLNDILIDMGMGLAFSDAADFKGIHAEGGIQISQVKQKTFVDVSEEGTEAAAATVVQMSWTSYPGESSDLININHPFLFVIREKSTNTIVFIGKVANPEYEN